MGKTQTYREELVYPQAAGEISKYTNILNAINQCLAGLPWGLEEPGSINAASFKNLTLQGAYYDVYLAKVEDWTQEYTVLYRKLITDFKIELEKCHTEADEKLGEWKSKAQEKRQVPV